MKPLSLIGLAIFAGLLSCTKTILRDTPVGGGSWADVAIDQAGNAYFVGVNRFESNSASRYVTSKYDKRGNKLWERRYRNPLDDVGEWEIVELDCHGNAYVTGMTRVHKTANKHDNTAFGYLTVKYASDGEELWTALYQEQRKILYEPVGMVVDRRGNVYITGQSIEPDVVFDLDIPEVSFKQLLTPPRSDFVTIKYNTQGKELWAARYNEQAGHDNSPRDIAVDEGGNVYVTGDSSVYRQDGIDHCIATVKYDTNGHQLWNARYAQDANSKCESTAIALDSAANVHVVGAIWNEGYSDLVTIKYDTNGSRQWVGHYRESKEKWTFPCGIDLDRQSNVYVTCYTPLRPSRPSHFPPASAGPVTRPEVVTLKYDAAGKEVWRAKYEEPLGDVFFYPSEVVADAGSDVHVIGGIAGPTYPLATLVITYDAKGNERKTRELETVAEYVKFISALSR